MRPSADGGPRHVLPSGTLDPLRRDDIERARATSPEEKGRQTLELVRLGISLKRASLRTKFPDLSSDEIDARLAAWLARDGERID